MGKSFSLPSQIGHTHAKWHRYSTSGSKSRKSLAISYQESQTRILIIAAFIILRKKKESQRNPNELINKLMWLKHGDKSVQWEGIARSHTH